MRDRSIALVVRENRILSVRTHRFGGTVNELPGGGIEKGETPEEAAVRELKEECGLDGTVIRLLNVLHWKDGSTEYVYLMDVSPGQKESVGTDPETLPGEEPSIRDVRWLKLTEFSERERAFLWSWGLLDVDGFLDTVVSWGDEISYPEGNAGMRIEEICAYLKGELLDSGYTYGFCLDGKVYRPDTANGFDREFYNRLLTEYRIQDPEDTRKYRVGTCNDAVVLMKSMLEERNVPCRIWLLHDRGNGKFHTVLTFAAGNRTVYLELTPQFSRPWYGKEILFDSDEAFVSEYSQGEKEVIDVTDFVVIGERPDFLLSRMG